MTAAVAPATGAVTVLRFSLDVAPDVLRELRGLLSRDERERAARLRFARDADRFVAGRGLLRSALAGRAGEAPEALRIAYGPAGKPYLPDHPELRFNASGAGGAGLVAVAEDVEVGIDVEPLEPGADDLAVARSFFCPSEVAELEALEPGPRQAAFVRAWTRKEAYVKALGEGLQLDLDRVAVSSVAGEPARLTWASRPGEVERWTLVDLSRPSDGLVAALCHDGGSEMTVTDAG